MAFQQRFKIGGISMDNNIFRFLICLAYAIIVLAYFVWFFKNLYKSRELKKKLKIMIGDQPKFIKCELCGDVTLNEPHHMIAHTAKCPVIKRRLRGNDEENKEDLSDT